MTDIEKKLQAQIDELEMKQAFQEQTIEELNDALTQQQFLIEKMQVQMRYLVGKVKSGQVSNIASESEETPPPHY
ncbi:SlyX family protein [Photobacterium galatheae]|uniref:Protein SlyX homolog n=1 Tax=Photobacterium galatheae TaxID=1654360 RepID=A0A066RJR7_9GAMM|nr:SlyX family protein [Photobacterium galatheae]KDM90574.1 SlyX [Photobacterium galatheae]MCM0150734.1 SlyX family protein [Photobacterium galatheae]